MHSLKKWVITYITRSNQVLLNFTKHGVKKATNDKQNLDTACEHFEKGEVPKMGELDEAITNMISLMAPGESGLSPMAMEKLPRKAKIVKLEVVH
jgi:hypothetical protein